jgi:flagellar protein FlaJ
MDITKKQKTMLAALAVSAILVVIGLVLGDLSILANMLLAAVIIAILPPFLYKYSTYRWVKSLEEQFPNFVRDLADSRRSGMSFSESIKLASKANYGRLSPEIQRMHNKLSWGIPFSRVIDMFQERVKNSRLISESLTIIKESYHAGGDVASTLDAIARDMIMLKETEAERVSMVKQSVMIMYGIFFMFVGIAIMIIYVMIPMIQSQPTIQTGSFGFSFSNPCEGVSFFPCNVFEGIGFLLEVPPGIANYYISIFFMVVLIQGIFTGLIAGQMGENSIIAGSKHSMVMVFAGIGIFIFLAKLGLLPT